MLRVRLLALRWKMEAQSFAGRVWSNSLFGVALIVVFDLLYAYWCLHIPSPGKAVAALAVAAAVMTFRAEPGGLQKIGWIFLLFAFLYMEIKAIDDKERIDEAERSAARKQEAQSFRDITAGLQATVTQGQIQFEATSKALQAAISASTEIFKNTHPRAVVEFQQIRPRISSGKLAADEKIPFDVWYTNRGLDLARNVALDGTTFVAPLDDEASQVDIGKRFDKWWSATKHGHVDIQTDEPRFGGFFSQKFSASDAEAVNDHKDKATIYVLMRWVYTDSTGRWVGDLCFGFQDFTVDFNVLHPCSVHNNHRYRMPASMVTPLLK